MLKSKFPVSDLLNSFGHHGRSFWLSCDKAVGLVKIIFFTFFCNLNIWGTLKMFFVYIYLLVMEEQSLLLQKWVPDALFTLRTGDP